MLSNRFMSSLVVKDGGKTKPSKALLTIVAGLVVFAVVGLQFISSVKTNATSPTPVETPKVDLGTQVTPPSVTSGLAVQKAEARKTRAAKMREAAFQPLKSFVLQPKIEIPVGSEVSATLSSGGSNGTVTALLDANVDAEGDTVLPKGTLLYGKGTSSEDRLYISFSTAVLPDKKKQKITASAFDQNDRMEGLKGKKISDYVFKLATSSGLFFLGGLADGMRDDNYSTPFTQRRTTVKDAALNGVSTAAVETGRDMLQKMNEEKARIEVKATTKIVVIFGDPTDGQ